MIAGFAGVVLVVGAYLANQTGHLQSDYWLYPAANLVGALLILVSLWTAWNFPSAVIEVVWALVSVYGLFRSRRRSLN